MKTVLALILLAAAVNCRHAIVPPHPQSGPRSSIVNGASEIVRQAGYPVQTLLVETVDGYKLEITRIPGKQDEREVLQKQLEEGEGVQTKKPVVLLMHGIFGDSSEFLLNSDNSIAYLLADKGYDVFLGNFRGANNSDDQHVRMNSQRDRAFWNYCFDDMGKSDLPAIIDRVLGITKEQKLYYIGFNQANTALYILLSQKPEYNNKIEKAIALGPVVFMEHSRNPLMQLISDNDESAAWVVKSLGSHQLNPSEEFITQVHNQCVAKHGEEHLCRNLYFLTNAFGHVYQSAVATKFGQAYPSKTSTRTLLHYAQLIETNKFHPYGKTKDDEEYALDKVTVPVIIVSVPRDVLADERDVDRLHNKLPNVQEHIKVNDYSSNLDLILDSNARSIVYERIAKSLHKSK